MKKVFLLLFLLISCCSYGQSVLGIDFGSSYEETKRLLKKRFTGYEINEYNGLMFVCNSYIGGVSFGLGMFLFQYSGDSSYFSSATFSDVQLTASQAKAKRDEFANMIKQKYADNMTSWIDSDGFKVYEFGTNPLNENKSLGFIFIVKNKNNTYDAVLRYGPFHFIDPNSDL